MNLALAQAAAGAADNDAYLLWGFILAAGALGILFLELLVPSGGLLGLLCGVAAIASIVSFGYSMSCTSMRTMTSRRIRSAVM